MNNRQQPTARYSEMYESHVDQAAKHLWLLGDVFGSGAVQDAMQRAGLGYVASHNLTAKQFHQLRLLGLMELRGVDDWINAKP